MKRSYNRQTDSLELLFGSRPLRRACALVLGLVSLTVWLWAGSVGLGEPYPGLVLAVLPVSIASALVFGFPVGVATVALAGFFGWYVILPPELSFAFIDTADRIYFAIVLAAATFATFVFGIAPSRVPKV